MVYTCVQYGDVNGGICAMFQTENLRDAWTWARSVGRYMANRRGYPLGFFDARGTCVDLYASPDPWQQWESNGRIIAFYGTPATPVYNPLQLDSIARACRIVYSRAVCALGADLGGFSPLDLLCDNFDLPVRTLQDAAIVAGIPGISSQPIYETRR